MQKLKDLIIKSHKKRKNNKNNVKNGFKFAIHPVTIIFGFASVFVGMFWLFFMYLICLLVHEFSHYLVAKKLGYFCEKITLYPTGALLNASADEFTFKDEILISLAGPFSNILLCIICVFLWWIVPEIYNYTADFVVANISIAFFNLLPVFPLDGGRVVLAMLSNFFSRKKATAITKNITLFFSLILFVVFILSLFILPNFQIGISSVVIFITVIAEDKQAVYKRIIKTDLKRRKLAHGVKVVYIMFGLNTMLSKVLSKIDNFAYYVVQVVDDDFNVLTTITEDNLYNIAKTLGANVTLGSALHLT